MGIYVRWSNPNKTRIETCFQDPWTLDDFLEMRKQWHQMIKSVDGTVEIVLDLRPSFEPPAGFMGHFIALQQTPHSRQGRLYILGMNPPYRKLSHHLFGGITAPDKAARFINSPSEVLQP